jgi:hypothetical protein
MTFDETLAIINEWRNHFTMLNIELDKFTAVTQEPTKLHEAIYRMAGQYTAAVEKLVGDDQHWMEWWADETDFGAKCWPELSGCLKVWVEGEENPRYITSTYELTRLIVEKPKEDA